METLAEQLATAAPRTYKAKHTTEDSDFVAMMQRQLRALEARAINDPALLPQVLMLAQRLAEIVNVVIATSADTFRVDPYAAPSMGECARVLGITKQSASDRRKLGEQVIAGRLAELGVESFALARREREARERAARHAAETMPVYTERRHLRAVS